MFIALQITLKQERSQDFRVSSQGHSVLSVPDGLSFARSPSALNQGPSRGRVRPLPGDDRQRRGPRDPDLPRSMRGRAGDWASQGRLGASWAHCPCATG